MVNVRKSYPWDDSRATQFTHALGGIVGWVGIHALSFLNAATGEGFRTVAGMESHQLRPEAFSECPDNCGLVFGLSGGGHATVSLDYHRPKTAPTHGDDWIRLVGTRGVVEAHLAKKEFQLMTHQKAEWDGPLPPPVRVYEQYLRALMGKEDRTIADALTEQIWMLTNACLHAQEAVDQGTTVAIAS